MVSVLLALLGVGLPDAEASRYAMEHNHPDLRWFTIETEHVSIHYPVSRRDPDHPRWASGEGTAQRLAAVADDIWLRLCSEIGYFPGERVDVVILEHTDELEGFTLTPQDWIVFSGNPGPELARMRGRLDWVEDLFAHELAHVITLKQSAWLAEGAGSYGVEIGGLAEDGANQLGFTLDVDDTVPHWFSEGAAEFWSERIGVNWWTSQRDMTLRTSARNGRLLSDREWEVAHRLDDWYDGERAYQQGYAFHRWFADRYGDAAWREVMARSGRRFQVDWERGVERVAGASMASLKRQFEADARAEADAFVARVDAAGRVEGEELTLWALSWNERFTWTADWWANRDADDREDAQEATGSIHLHAAYSPDGTWLGRHRSGWLEVRAIDEQMWSAFAGDVPDRDQTRAQRDRDQRLSIWLPARYMGDFDFVPGDDALVSVAWEGEDRLSFTPEAWHWTQLYRVDLTPTTEKRRHRGGREAVEVLDDAEGAIRKRMTAIPGTLRAMDPSVSPDGQWLAYTQYRDGTSNVFVSRIDGSEKRALTTWTDGSWASGTDWSPDGTQVVFAAHHADQQNLWIADLGSGDVDPLTTDRWEEVDPHWAVDGSIWFAADVDGVSNIFRWKDGRVRQVTRVTTGATSPSVTPDGNLLYTHYTAFGWKAFGLERTRFAWDDVTERFDLDGDAVVLADPPERPASEPYRPMRSLTGLAIGPTLRLDRGFDARVRPRLGGYLRLRDAVEVHTWSLDFWVGGDAYVGASWQWHKLWPDVILRASHWAGRRATGPGLAGDADLKDPDRRMLTTGSVTVVFPWSESLSFDVSGFGFWSRREREDRFERVLSSRVVTLGMRTGDGSALRRSNTRRGTASRVVLTRGDSVGEDAYAYHRAEVDLHSVFDAPAGDDHRMVARLAGGVTDRVVHPEDTLQVGGDHPYALRNGRVQSTLPMPGYAPFAVSGQHVAVGGLAWRFPLARDLAASERGLDLGPVTVDEVFGQIGGHVGAAWSGLRGGRAPPVVLADAVAEVRIGASLWDTRWNSAIRGAWGVPSDQLSDPLSGPRVPGGFRFLASIGSGW
jgi:hypothetical protein